MAPLLTPEKLASSGTEHGHQSAIFLWAIPAGMNCPVLRLMFAIPNGGSRGDTSRSAMIRGNQLKSEGVKPGVPDIFLPVCRGNHAGLFIEMKKPKGEGSRVDPDQKEWHDALRAQYYRVEVCWGWMEARDVLCNYLGIDYDGKEAPR